MSRDDSLDTLTTARLLAESGFFGEVRDAGKALAKILAGRELGMGPIASLMGVYYQQGKVTYSANIMAAAVKKSGRYTYRVKTIGTAECSIEFFERSGPEWESIGTSTFTIKDAQDAGLTTGPNKHNWSKFTRNMLFARAMSNGAKWYTPDVFGGVTPYTPDELGAEVSISDDGDMKPVIEEMPVTEQPRRDGNTPKPAPERPAPEPEQPHEDGEPDPPEEDQPPQGPNPRCTHGGEHEHTCGFCDHCYVLGPGYPEHTCVARQVAISRYYELAKIATDQQHEKAAAINAINPSSIADLALMVYIKKLESMFSTPEPEAAPA
jgi:hypothetical protein